MVLNAGARKGKAVPTSLKTAALLLIHTFKSGKSVGSDRGKTTST
jgi:hypothetical protein